jgi:hypothetical protein
MSQRCTTCNIGGTQAANTPSNQPAVSKAAGIDTVDTNSANIGNSSLTLTQNDNFFTSSLPTSWGRNGGSGGGANPVRPSRGRGTQVQQNNSSPAARRTPQQEDDALSMAASVSLAPSIRPAWEEDDGVVQARLATMKLGTAPPCDEKGPQEEGGKKRNQQL